MTIIHTLASEWATFSRRVLNPAALETQRLEMQLAFYSGAFCALALAGRAADKGVSESAGVAILADLHAEANGYLAQWISARTAPTPEAPQ